MLPERVKKYLPHPEHSNDELEMAESESEVDEFHGEWSSGTSIWGVPTMSVDTTNRIIRDFIEAVDRLEEEMGREVEREERIVENGGSERIHNAELRDENGEFLQDVVDYQKKNLGGYFGDRFIARARYQTWHRNSPMDVYGVGDYEEPENLPIAPGDRGDKVWLEVKSPKKADESRYLRELIQHFRDIDDVSEYSSPNPELPH